MAQTAQTRGDALAVPTVAQGVAIPRIIHQTFVTHDLPDELAQNVVRLKEQNPGWTHVLYDDDEIRRFIFQEYGPTVLTEFERISPRYGAARADLFRYLLLYKKGGVYLDIKSGLGRPLDEILLPDDKFVLSQWDKEAHAGRQSFGQHAEITLPGGELQQWQIMAVAGHPFLLAVINRVLRNIAAYNPWKHGTGGNGVFRVTGPIAYTVAIEPLLSKHDHRMSSDTELGLIYSAISTGHRTLFKGHYLTRTDPVIRQRGLRRLSGWSYDISRQAKRLITTGSVSGKV